MSTQLTTEMISQHHLPITVGVDRSLGAEAAVLWGALQAQLRKSPLHVVSAYHWSMAQHWSAQHWSMAQHWSTAQHSSMAQRPSVVDKVDLTELTRKTALATLDRAGEQVRLRWPDVAVWAEAIEGRPSRVLTRQAEQSQLVVIGREQRGDEAPVAAIAIALAAHASSPFAVIPSGWVPPRHGCVVAGLDPHRDCTAVIAFAFDFAHLTNDSIHFVVCGHCEATHDFPIRLDSEIDVAARRFPNVTVRKQVVPGNPADSLTTAAHAQDLLVLGRHRGPGPLRRLFGSVGVDALGRATCPVSVIPESAVAERVNAADASDRSFWAADFGLTDGAR